MDIISAYREAGTYRGAAAISGTTPKTVQAGDRPARGRRRRPGAGAAGRNYDAVAGAGRGAGGQDVGPDLGEAAAAGGAGGGI